ncbi:polysaccharide deacetylase family protein [Chitinophaga pendula]|uniref:polysaccharide deacetylase family protein n=1 Tax=Chitinophaga TaxID=79328 RepID=UPI000BAF1396|nr:MULTISPECIES: polysaccharide deacetylase family protein [Chitinophaga]ASZ11293.1 polysaccharide deacetylase [Chitinophaga sp. MD30]UCJ05705.1 polysaccharide deacetylase family protein [Chitinophaga pendula]
MKLTNKILISVDVEEFDIPEEFGWHVPLDQKLDVSYRGLKRTLELFDQYGVTATFFITAFWAEHYPDLVKQMAAKHEIASHAYHHSSFSESDLESSRLLLQQISGQTVTGFRMPRLRPVSLQALKQAGYTYDASLNPTWLPGRYNNRHMPRLPFKKEGLWIMPSSVSPILRYPIFWLSVKNAPLWVTSHFSKTILKKDHMLSCYFHPWELTNLEGYRLPAYIRRVSGQRMETRLKGFLQMLQSQGSFCTHRQWLSNTENTH